MTEPRRSLLGSLKAEIGSLGSDLKEMVELRWQLAHLELQTALGQAKGLAIALLVAAVMGLSALPILAVAVAELLRGWLGIPYWGWLLLFGFVLLFASATAAHLAWHRFRRRFVGMEESLDELREDLVWIKEKR